MASIGTDDNGRRRVLFFDEGRRKTLRLGRVSMRQAETVRLHVEHLQAAKANGGAVGESTRAWLGGVSTELRSRMAAVGLIEDRPATTVAGLVSSWLARRVSTLAPGTVVRLKQGERSLVAFFGADRLIQTITEGDAEDFRASLLSQDLSEATVRKRCSDACVWFRYAMRTR